MCCILVIFPLRALITFSCCLLCPRGLLDKEIKGGYNYGRGKLKHCLLEANWILPQTAGQFISPPDTGVMSMVAARAIKTLCSCLQNTTVFFFLWQPEPQCRKQLWRLFNERIVQPLTEVGWRKYQKDINYIFSGQSWCPGWWVFMYDPLSSTTTMLTSFHLYNTHWNALKTTKHVHAGFHLYLEILFMECYKDLNSSGERTTRVKHPIISSMPILQISKSSTIDSVYLLIYYMYCILIKCFGLHRLRLSLVVSVVISLGVGICNFNALTFQKLLILSYRKIVEGIRL